MIVGLCDRRRQGTCADCSVVGGDIGARVAVLPQIQVSATMTMSALALPCPRLLLYADTEKLNDVVSACMTTLHDAVSTCTMVGAAPWRHTIAAADMRVRQLAGVAV